MVPAVWSHLSQPPGFSLRLQKCQHVSFSDGALHVPDDGAVAVVHELDSDLEEKTTRMRNWNFSSSFCFDIFGLSEVKAHWQQEPTGLLTKLNQYDFTNVSSITMSQTIMEKCRLESRTAVKQMYVMKDKKSTSRGQEANAVSPSSSRKWL